MVNNYSFKSAIIRHNVSAAALPLPHFTLLMHTFKRFVYLVKASLTMLSLLLFRLHLFQILVKPQFAAI